MGCGHSGYGRCSKHTCGWNVAHHAIHPAACSGLLVFFTGVFHLNAARPMFFIPRELARRAGLVAFTAA